MSAARRPAPRRAGRAAIVCGLLSAAVAVQAVAQDAPADAGGHDGVSTSGGAVVPAAQAQQPRSTPALLVTLDEVLDRVAAASPLVGVADGELSVAGFRRLEARFARFPRFRASVGLAPAPRVELEYSEELGGLDPYSNRASDADLLRSLLGGAGIGTRAELETTLPITTFGKVQLARQLADIGVDVARVRRDVAVRESQFQAVRAYFVLQWYDDVSPLLREAERRLEEAATRLEERLDDGDASARTTLRQLTIGRAAFVELRGEADSTAIVARRALASALDLPPAFEVSPGGPEAAPEVLPSVDEVLAFARVHRQDARLLDAAVEAAHLEARSRRRALTPDVALMWTIGGAYTPTVDDISGPFIHDPYNRFGFGFALGAQWAMNPGTMVARVRRAEAEIVVAEQQRDAAWFGAESEIVEAWGEAVARANNLAARGDAAEAARAWLNQVSFQYDQGLAGFEALQAPLEAYYGAAGALHEAALRYRIAVANLALKCGAPSLLAWPTAE